MLKGATAKRFYYFMSALLRFIDFVGLLIAFIVVACTLKPAISWLNGLLITLSLLGLATSLFNLILCGFTASAYKQNFKIQLICFILTLVTGGIISSTMTGLAAFTKVELEEIKNEKIFNTKTFKNKDGKFDEETKRK